MQELSLKNSLEVFVNTKEIDNFKNESKEVLDFLKALKACWLDGF